MGQSSGKQKANANSIKMSRHLTPSLENQRRDPRASPTFLGGTGELAGSQAGRGDGFQRLLTAPPTATSTPPPPSTPSGSNLQCQVHKLKCYHNPRVLGGLGWIFLSNDPLVLHYSSSAPSPFSAEKSFILIISRRK